MSVWIKHKIKGRENFSFAQNKKHRALDANIKKLCILYVNCTYCTYSNNIFTSEISYSFLNVMIFIRGHKEFRIPVFFYRVCSMVLSFEV